MGRIPLFCNGKVRSNACVGENGGAQTLWNYASNYFYAAERLFVDLSRNKYLHTEKIIFPLIYNVRHGVELYIKSLLYEVPKIRKAQAIRRPGHNIKSMWNVLKAILQRTDRRFNHKDIAIIDQYISELSSIDPNGEVFRYPENRENMIFLKDINIINAEIFWYGAKIIKKQFEKLSRLAEILQAEYSRSPYTKMLSPLDLEEIAKKLPPRYVWDEKPSILKKTKAKLIEEYKIQNKELDQAIKIIERHRKLSSHIGVINELTFLKAERFNSLLNICSAQKKALISTNKMGDENISIQDLLKEDDTKDMFKSFSDNELSDIYALYYIGTDNSDASKYEKILKIGLNKVKSDREGTEYYLSGKIHIFDYILIGLSETGQVCVIAELDR